MAATSGVDGVAKHRNRENAARMKSAMALIIIMAWRIISGG